MSMTGKMGMSATGMYPTVSLCESGKTRLSLAVIERGEGDGITSMLLNSG